MSEPGRVQSAQCLNWDATPEGADSDGYWRCGECPACVSGRSLPLCGDPTCESYGCTQEAIDAWHERNEDAARDYVRSVLGLPPMTTPASSPPPSGQQV